MTVQQLNLPIPLAELRQAMQRNGVVKAQLFGSYARGDATPESDLDLLVELAPGRTYLDLGGLQYELEEQFGIRVDVMTKLNHHFEPYIKNDLIEIL